jgi:dTDP-4-dehydrorhamnose 3,5-epimerase
MQFTKLELSGLILVESTAHADVRGHFMEAFNARNFATEGIQLDLQQHNISHSKKDVVRGLHFQWDKPLDKFIRVTRGSAFLVAVDIRKQSPTYGKWYGKEIKETDHLGLYAPFGFATGFCALEDATEIEYYYSAFFNPQGESNIAWNDPDLAIVWPITEALLSDRDAAADSLAAWAKKPESDLFT